MKKPIPIGYEDIREIINKNFYYIDKSLMIKMLLDRPAKATLFTRPRRFGKTLNLSMIRRFFEMELDGNGKQIDNKYLFDGLKIASCGEPYLSYQQQYPVINLSLKSAKQPNFEMAYGMLKKQISEEYDRHKYVLMGTALMEREKAQYLDIMNLKEDPLLYADALKFLSMCLTKYHGKSVIILIDEYDVPLENAWLAGFYQELITFIRSLFESALKTNPFLEFAVITGCLRISKESIFTGLNNLTVQSVLSPGYTACFGFTETEVKQLLSYYELTHKYEDIRNWYDGYQFGHSEIYNPWSIMNYAAALIIDQKAFPKPYWSNTSSNSIIRELVENADFEVRQEMEWLMTGNSIEKSVHEDITYEEIYESKNNLWNFLYFTGYLKNTGARQEGRIILMSLAIPNQEILAIYEDTILAWFDKKMRQTDLSQLFTAINQQDCETFGRILSHQLLDTISFYDYAENYYHGFLVGLLKNWADYGVLSNRESGAGRPDIILTASSDSDSAIILELKVAERFQKMETLCLEALNQIREKDYEAALRTEGYTDIKAYGICFYQKKCLVMSPEHGPKGP